MKRRDLSLMAIFLPLYYLAFYMCRYSVLPVGPILTEKMKLSTGAYGLSLSALYAGYAFMLMPAGIIARKWGAKKAILAGLCHAILLLWTTKGSLWAYPLKPIPSLKSSIASK